MIISLKTYLQNLSFNTKLTLNNFALVFVIYFLCFAFVTNYIVIDSFMSIKGEINTVYLELKEDIGESLFHDDSERLKLLAHDIGSRFDFDVAVFMLSREENDTALSIPGQEISHLPGVQAHYTNTENEWVNGKRSKFVLRATRPSLTEWFMPETLIAKQIDPLMTVQFENVLFHEKKPIGYIRVRFPLMEIIRPLEKLIIPTITVIAISVVLLIVLAQLFVQNITGPLEALTDASQNVERDGDYSIRARKYSEDEIGKLADSFNSMLEQIQIKSADLEAEKKKVEDINARLLINQGRLKIMTYELSKLEEEERHKLGEELHDGICQLLVISKMRMNELVDTGMVNDTQDTRDLIDMIGDAVKYTRTLLFELSSPILYELGLRPAVDRLCEDFQSKHGLSVTVDHSRFTTTLPEEKKIFLFRSIRELLINIVKHAKCETAEVILNSDTDQIVIEVNDSGPGFDESFFDTKKVEGARYGLYGIRERIGYLGGKVEINSKKGIGSSVKLLLPISEEHGIEHDKSTLGG